MPPTPTPPTPTPPRRDDGFTLVELLIVVLIVAVLLAIAVPTFLGARTGAQDRAAQASARGALATARIVEAAEGYAAAGVPASLAEQETSHTYTTSASTAPTVVSVAANATTFVAVSRSDTGTCFGLRDAGGVVTYGRGPCTADADVVWGVTAGTSSGW